MFQSQYYKLKLIKKQEFTFFQFKTIVQAKIFSLTVNDHLIVFIKIIPFQMNITYSKLNYNFSLLPNSNDYLKMISGKSSFTHYSYLQISKMKRDHQLQIKTLRQYLTAKQKKAQHQFLHSSFQRQPKLKNKKTSISLNTKEKSLQVPQYQLNQNSKDKKIKKKVLLDNPIQKQVKTWPYYSGKSQIQGCFGLLYTRNESICLTLNDISSDLEMYQDKQAFCEWNDFSVDISVNQTQGLLDFDQVFKKIKVSEFLKRQQSRID